MRLARHRADDRLDRRAFEVDILRVASRPLEAHDPVRDRDHAVRHRLHHHPVDVRDFVVAGVDGVHRPNAGGNVAVDMQPELVRLADARRQPRRVEGAVELDPDEAVGLGFVHQRDRLGLAGRDIGHLRGVGALAVDERGGIDVRRQQRARGRSAPAIDRAHVVVAGIAHRGHAHRQLLQPGEVVADVHVAVPQARDQASCRARRSPARRPAPRPTRERRRR